MWKRRLCCRRSRHVLKRERDTSSRAVVYLRVSCRICSRTAPMERGRRALVTINWRPGRWTLTSWPRRLWVWTLHCDGRVSLAWLVRKAPPHKQRSPTLSSLLQYNLLGGCSWRQSGLAQRTWPNPWAVQVTLRTLVPSRAPALGQKPFAARKLVSYF